MRSSPGGLFSYSFGKLVIIIVVYLLMVMALFLFFPQTVGQLAAILSPPTATEGLAGEPSEGNPAAVTAQIQTAEAAGTLVVTSGQEISTDASTTPGPGTTQPPGTAAPGETQMPSASSPPTDTPTATSTDTPVPTPTFTLPPGGTLLVKTNTTVRLKEAQGTDDQGRPILVERQPAVILGPNTLLSVNAQPITASDGELYYQVVGDIYYGLYVRVADVDIL